MGVIPTFEKYKSIIELRLLPIFKDLPINSIKTSDIKSWLFDIDDVGGKSKRIYISVVKGIFDEALYDELIEKNPVSRIRPPEMEKPLIHPFTPQEVRDIIKSAEMSNYRNYLKIAFLRGCDQAKSSDSKKRISI